MSRPFASLWNWALGIAAAAVGLLAVRTWMTSRDVGEITAAVIVVMASVSVVSIPRRGRSAFWIGFVIAGWGWLAVSLGTSLGPYLPESHWIDAVRPPLASASDSGWPNDWLVKDQRDRDAYQTAGHCVVSLVLACACGAATRKLVAADDREPAAWRVPDGSLFRPKPGDGCDSP